MPWPCNWRQREALPPLLLSKAERGYRLFHNTPPATPVKAGDVAIDAATRRWRLSA
jgi:inorganic triphosphatase YgiF